MIVVYLITATAVITNGCVSIQSGSLDRSLVLKGERKERDYSRAGNAHQL